MGISDGPSVRLVPGTSAYLLLQIHIEGPCTCELNVCVRAQDGGKRVCGEKDEKSAKSGRSWEEQCSSSDGLCHPCWGLGGTRTDYDSCSASTLLSCLPETVVTRTCHCSTRCRQHSDFQLGH